VLVPTVSTPSLRTLPGASPRRDLHVVVRTPSMKARRREFYLARRGTHVRLDTLEHVTLASPVRVHPSAFSAR
jgi:hypothetical protein